MNENKIEEIHGQIHAATRNLTLLSPLPENEDLDSMLRLIRIEGQALDTSIRGVIQMPGRHFDSPSVQYLI